MEEEIIFIYCLADAALRALNYEEQPVTKMSNAEIITFVMISALFYQCNYKLTRMIAIHSKWFSTPLSQSRMSRRIHQIPEKTWLMIFTMSCSIISSCKEFIVDSFPVASCQNHKSFRCKQFHGYTSSKKQYFFGIKVHMIVSAKGIPIEFIFTSGSESDIRGLHRFNLDLPARSSVFADKAYTDYALEDFLKAGPKIFLIASRKKNSQRKHNLVDAWKLSIIRNRIETVFSSIISLMPRWIRARTEKGFCLKMMFFILAYTIKASYF